MAKVSEDARLKFREQTLESEAFKNLVKGIESCAEDGKTSFHYTIKQSEDARILGVFTNELTRVGYSVKNSTSIPSRGIVIQWGEDGL